MNKYRTQEDSFAELRAGMDALKSSLPASGLISDSEMRRAMRKKSLWLNRVVIGELIILPLIVVFLFRLAYVMDMNLWLVVTFVVCALPDAVLDFRTLAVSKKWIQDDTLVELSRKLIRQKKERQYQTIISTSLMVPWLIWCVYEFLKGSIDYFPMDAFLWTWGGMSVFCLIVSLCIIISIYRKAQRTNNEMIASLREFVENE